MQQHERLGELGEVLRVPDYALRQGDEQNAAPGVLDLLGATDEVGGDDHGDHQPDEEHHAVGMQPRCRAWVEREARGLVRVA